MKKTQADTPAYPERVYTVSEAHQFLRIGRSQFYDLMNAGKVGYVRQGSKRYVLESHLRRYLASLPVIESQS
ncbi:MAG: helix-turn-helix domain-containing protein [Candidatus Cybelea sp.]